MTCVIPQMVAPRGFGTSCALREREAAFQLRRERQQFIRDAMRSVQPVTERSE